MYCEGCGKEAEYTITIEDEGIYSDCCQEYVYHDEELKSQYTYWEYRQECAEYWEESRRDELALKALN